MRRFLLIVCLVLLNTLPVAACDVSLFAIIAGNSQNDVFSETVANLVSHAKALARNSQSKEEMPSHMQRFMVKWIEFNTRFTTNPPEWAKKDVDWKDKFNGLTELIGSIRTNLVSVEPNQPKAHSDIQKFSRQLTRLFDSLPMNSRSRLLLDITMHFDHIWDAWYAKNQQMLLESTEKFVVSCQKLAEELDDTARKLIEDILFRVAELQKMASTDKVFAGKTFEFMLSMAENEFAKFNDAQNAGASSTDNESATPTEK
ncbi:MAG: hypothetical protein ACD_39C00212G0002 [uncultured bacterium]|nr:MAG: hypothetical protein ACD_39C00212G0002 [uncultured bacterium]